MGQANGDSANHNPLALDAETMRAVGHQTVDMLVDMLCDAQAPALIRASPQEMARRVDAAAPEQPRPFPELLDQLRNDVLPFMSRLQHPRYFAYIPTCGTFPGALGDLIDSALGVDVGSWTQSAGPSRLELVVLDWFKDWIGYPPEAAGILVSGGSAANMTALACAREALLGPMTDRVVAYVSDQTHSSLARAARALGFRPEQVRVLPTDDRYRLTPETVAAAMDADAAAGLQPLLVTAAAGSTSTGAVDHLAGLAEVCRERGAWLHVDAAYGGFAALTERGRAQLAGIELADSVTLDPHKWLYQPIECGSLLVRDGALLTRAFEITPDYLADTMVEQEVNFADRGLQLTRSGRGLKLWLSIGHFGLSAFRRAIDRSLDLALLAQRHVEESDELQLMSPAQLGVLCFRRNVPGADEDEIAQVNGALVQRYGASGDGLVSSTRLRGVYAIRLCVMNHTSTEDDVRKVLDWFVQAPRPAPAAEPQAAAAPVPASAPSQTDPIADGWLGPPQIEPERLAALAVFEGVSAGQLARIASWGRELRVPAGEAVVRRWQAARDFFVIVEGSATADRDGELLRELAAGDFFGEIAALDWGAGYGYARSATVTAATPLRLLALGPADLGLLMRDVPAVAKRIERARRERMGR
ncbi:MAG: aromatic-L-amino-acid/L-tryptophan decarboxylase [Solirubrobacteraceae bacterium]|nr:aromatic-L-amino-acid/L-tryptophan decarboxylase [Solirubrobacteraceae bacterium]